MTREPWSAAVVQGDTESAFLGALTAFYNRVPVAHVEAGLRTYNLDRPFPEEALRQMIGRLTRFHFAPTPRAQAALVGEGIAAKNIYITGNTAVDAQKWSCEHKGVRRRTEGRGHLLVTVHRRESWGSQIDEICHAIADVTALHPDLDVIFPVHLNPVVRTPVEAILGAVPEVRLDSAARLSGDAAGPGGLVVGPHGLGWTAGGGTDIRCTAAGAARGDRASGSGRGWLRRAGRHRPDWPS